MFGYVTFNVKYYILSQIFYKKIGWVNTIIHWYHFLTPPKLKSVDVIYGWPLTWDICYCKICQLCFQRSTIEKISESAAASCTLLSCKSNLSKSQQYARSKWWLLWGRLHKVKYVRLTSKSSFSIRCVLCVHNCVHLYLASSHT